MRISVPCSVCSTSGWNWMPYRPREGSSKPLIGVEGDSAVTRAPSGAAVTESRWLIHPTCSSGRPPKSALDGIDAHLRPAELRAVRAFDAASEVARHQLHPVTDAEHGHAQAEDPRIGLRRTLRVDRGRPAREDERERPPRGDRRRGGRVMDELRVDAALADAPRDQLRVLAAEVDDEDGALFRRRLLERERDDLAH